MESFAQWLQRFRRFALRRGISAALLDRTLAGLTPDRAVIARDRTQPEAALSARAYMDRALGRNRVARGRTALRDHADALARIETAFGVAPEILVAIWGLESDLGVVRGDFDVIRSLATLAHEGRRARLFEAQLLAALRILAAGDCPRARLRGSWAGAMGHTQLMPASYLAHAVDLDGDGRCDIWGGDPTDALASAAALLAAGGWNAGMRWGAEVRLLPTFDHAHAGLDHWRPAADWAIEQVPDGLDPAQLSVVCPAGAGGPAFALGPNFRALLRYNNAPLYALAVGVLADRIAGRSGLATPWPEDAALGLGDRRELQQRLVDAGYDTGGVDGVLGPASIAAIRAWQQQHAMVPDGHGSAELLARMRAEAGADALDFRPDDA